MQPDLLEGQLALRGHSGCEVTIVSTTSGTRVVKSGAGPQADRLRQQISKQRDARDSNELDFIRVPAILAESEVAGRYAATMEYVYFQSAPAFFYRASLPALRRVAELLIGFVEAEVESSPVTSLSTDPVVDKLDKIASALAPTPWLDQYRPHLERLGRQVRELDTISIPVGRCHGDLTMSNLMIARDASALALIDFLDSFIESPLLDLAKLRQDTAHCWTALMTDAHVDVLRFRQIMGVFDRLLFEPFCQLDWFRDHIELMTDLTLLRIAPYASDPPTHRFILSALRDDDRGAIPPT